MPLPSCGGSPESRARHGHPCIFGSSSADSPGFGDLNLHPPFHLHCSKMEYEDLSVEPRHYPDCCLALSRRLIDALADSLLQKPAVTLSIGSGSGLLEATLLKRHEDHIDVRGVEVADLVHKHLPEQNTITVNGTWDLYPDAALATAWMFVYPREPRLLGRYIDTHGRGNLDRIIWLGPKMDWQDYEPVFLKSDFRSILVLPACGVAEYEMVAIASRP